MRHLTFVMFKKQPSYNSLTWLFCEDNDPKIKSKKQEIKKSSVLTSSQSLFTLRI